MSSPQTPHGGGDASADLAARFGSLGIGVEEQYPASPGGAYATTTPRAQQSFNPYADPNQYGQYYAGANPYETPFTTGLVNQPSSNYPYGGPPPDLPQPMPAMGGYEAYGEAFQSIQSAAALQADRQPGATLQTGYPTPVSNRSIASVRPSGYRPGLGSPQMADQNISARGQYQNWSDQQSGRGYNPGHQGERRRLSGASNFNTAQPVNRFGQPMQNFGQNQAFNSPTHGQFMHNTTQNPNYSPMTPQAQYVTPPNYVRTPYTPVSMSTRPWPRRENETRDAMLEDYRLSKVTRQWHLSEIKGHIIAFCGDQHGSRFIQQELSVISDAARHQLLEEIVPNLYQLMTDVFGNYVIQKLFEVCNQEEKAALGKRMEGHVLQLSTQMYGCRVVQKALEHVLAEQRDVLVEELRPCVLECVKSSNANHVIQRLIALDPPDFVLEAFVGNILELGTHAYGCRVLQRTFECVPPERIRALIDELHQFTVRFTMDQFGNYVVQSVIEKGTPEDRHKIIDKLLPQIQDMCKHKFASNVIEKALTFGSSEDRKLIIDRIIGLKADGTSEIPNLLRDQFGNFPVQTALSRADKPQRLVMLGIIRPLMPTVRHTPVGKRLEQRINQYDSEGNDLTASPQPSSTDSAVETPQSSSVVALPESVHGSRADTATSPGSKGDENKALDELLK